jgi:predicted RNA-binding Zn-ribbon protein involved in translation (DUF1610 family)
LDTHAKEEDITLILGKNVILKIVEHREVEEILSRSATKELLKCEDLCHKDTIEPIQGILQLNEERAGFGNEVIEMSEMLLRERARLTRIFRQSSKKSRNRKAAHEFSIEDEQRFMNRYFGERIASFKRVVQENDRKMIELEKKLQSCNPHIHLLTPATLLLCRKCGSPLMKPSAQGREAATPPAKTGHRRPLSRQEIVWGEIKTDSECVFCGSKVTRNDAKRVLIHEISPDFLQLFRNELWFELYLADLLSKLEWKTWAHVGVLGMSGILQEIDVLAIKKGFVLCVECKTGRTSREDAFKFWVKVSDLKSPYGIYALLKNLPESETREFLSKSPGIIVLEGMANKRKKDIVEFLKQSVIARGQN